MTLERSPLAILTDNPGQSLLFAAALESATAAALHVWSTLPPVVPVALAGAAGATAVIALAALLRKKTADPLHDAVYAATLRGGEAWLICDSHGTGLEATNAFEAAFPGMGGVAGALDDVRRLAVDPDATAELDRLMASAVGGRSARGDVRTTGLDGSLRWWRFRAMPDGAGHVIWRAEDVTRQREQAALGRLEAEMTVDFLDNLPVGFFALDIDGEFTYVNATFARWVGHSPGDMVRNDQGIADILCDDKVLPEDGVGHARMRDATGEIFRAFVIRNSRPGGNGTRAVVLRDPEDDAEIEAPADVPEGEDTTPQWLFDHAPIGIAVLNLDGSICACNPALARFLRSAPDELAGTMLASHVAAEDRDELGSTLSKLVMGTTRAAHVEVRLPKSGDGVAQEGAASLHATRMDDINGELDAIALHVIDETEHRDLEVQFTQSQKMQAVGQLAGGVAHDFNNLLTAMIGFSDLLLLRHGPDDPSFADIMQIKQNANRATNLVRQLLAFSRKQTLEPVVLDPTDALADLSHLLGRLIGEQVELRFEHAPDIYLIRADRGQFDQVIINLVVNARDAMPGGGTLVVRTRNEAVAAPVQRGAELMPAGTYVAIEVSDTGTGIAKENLDRIFEPFYSTKEVGAGTGLGLSTVYGIVRQSEGYIFVDSAIGHGTAFSIYLPAYGAEGATGAQAAAAADKALATRRAEQAAAGEQGEEAADLTGVGTVLLVEDEEAVRMFGARALRNKGYNVLEADNGESGLDIINGTDETIDLIVSDVVMPGMDGHTFVQLVRQEMPEVKVILMSGYAEDVFREEISRDPTIHFLAKPFSLKALAGTVKDVMAE